MAVDKQLRRAKVKAKRRDKNQGDKPTKEEYAVAKFVRFNCATKKATIMGDELPYFLGCKAVDCLMSSKFAGDGNKKIFSNRHGCVFYMQTLLDKGLFFRAKKLVPKTKDVKQLVSEAKEQQQPKPDENLPLSAVAGKRKKKDDDQKKGGGGAGEETAATTKDATETSSATTTNTTSTKKRSKKVKFDLHQNQTFNDSNDIYVWRYDPTSTKMFFLGLAMVFGAIGICLFPLWPHEVRVGVYYLSIGAMVFVGLIIFLVVLRTLLFALVWLVTMGKHHFWLLPHLTDDCGFFDSFKPLYTHTTKPSAAKETKQENDKKDKESDKNNTDDDEDFDENDEKMGGGGEGENAERPSAESSGDDEPNLSVDEEENQAEPLTKDTRAKKRD